MNPFCVVKCIMFAKAGRGVQVYDLSLHAALVVQGCGPRRLEVKGEWEWLLDEFAATYGIRSSYTTLAHLLWVIRRVALLYSPPNLKEHSRKAGQRRCGLPKCKSRCKNRAGELETTAHSHMI